MPRARRGGSEGREPALGPPSRATASVCEPRPAGAREDFDVGSAFAPEGDTDSGEHEEDEFEPECPLIRLFVLTFPLALFRVLIAEL